MFSILDISVSDFYFKYFRDRCYNYWKYLADLWPHRQEENLLLVHYEDLHENIDMCIRKIAKFLGIQLDTELLELVKCRSSHAYMLAHKERFDGRAGRMRPVLLTQYTDAELKQIGRESKSEPMKVRLDVELDKEKQLNKEKGTGADVLQPLAYLKVRPGGGQIGQGNKNIPLEVKTDMAKVWQERLLPVTGCKDYEALRAVSSLLNDN